MDLDVLLSYLYDKSPDILQGGSRAALKQGANSLGLSPGVDYLSQQTGDLFKPMSFEDTEEDKARKAKLAELFSARDAEAAAANAPDTGQADLQKLIEAGKRASEQREYMQGTVPLMEDYEKGIAIGGQKKRGSAEDIAFRIRAEARAKGRSGSLKGGSPTDEDYYAAANSPRWNSGSLTTSEMTPELAQRLSERDTWASEQPMRDAEWEGDLASKRQDPNASAIAGEKLLGLQRNQQVDRQQRTQDALVSKIGDGSGKIPFEQAMQLEAAGVQIPYGARGMSPEQFDAKINDIVQRSSVDLKMAEEAQMMGAPPDATNAVIGFSAYIERKAREIKALVDAGKLSRDEGTAMLDRIIDEEARSSNAIKAYQLIQPPEGQPQAQVGK